MKRIYLLLAFIITFTLIPFSEVRAAGAIPKGAKEFDGNYYYVYKEEMTWEAAKETCESLGGHLAVITSAREQNFINKLAGDSIYWLGGLRLSGEWKWITGEVMKFSGWEYGAPEVNNDDYYMYYRGSNNTWNYSYIGDASSCYYICEWEDEDVDTRLPVKAVISSVKKAAKTSVTITWKTVSDAEGYSLYMKTGAKGNYKKIANIKEGDVTTYLQNGLSVGNTYYFRVRAYKTVYGEKSYGELSISKKITLK